MSTIDFHGAMIPIELVLQGEVESRYEPEEVEQAFALFSPGDRVVVAGAGVGWLAACIAAKVGADNVVCVEPIRHLARLVEQNVAVDGTPVRCLWGALTSDGQPVGLRFDEDNWALTNTQIAGPAEVPGHALSAFFDEGFDCLALDVEGAEELLLDKETAAGIRKLLLEVHVFAIGGEPAMQMRGRLASAGLHRTVSCVRDTSNGLVEIDSWAR